MDIENQKCRIVYEKVKAPDFDETCEPVILTEKTYAERREKVLNGMKTRRLDLLLIYADREHGANFAYLTGFEPRFEEGVLLLWADGSARLMLGNENLKMSAYSRLKAEAIHVPHFSLPNQPMETEDRLEELFRKAGITDGMKVGIAGWKMFTGKREENAYLFEVPCFIVNTVKRLNVSGEVINGTDIFQHPDYGARAQVNANEIAHYEFGAALASRCVYRALNVVAPGKTEMEIAGEMCTYGQPVSVTTICATGERFQGGVVFPRNKIVEPGDRFSLTMGLRGGLTSRAAYAANGPEDLPEEVRNYLEIVAMPYYQAAVCWYETVKIGLEGSVMYRKIEEVLPKGTFHWTLNPGHLTADEEWMSSPFYPDSKIQLKSGSLLQMDIIPSMPGYGGAGAEDGIALADEVLRQEIEHSYPVLWKRFLRRRKYMEEVLGIRLNPETLPMSDIAGYMRPFLFNKTRALKVRGAGENE